jgi:LacI family transcriptional regulator
MLASALNLSPGTVSKALKDSYEISAETKQKVMEMARRLDYVPNPYAGGLRKRKSKTIGIVLPVISDSFFALAIEGIEAVVHEKGYHVLICLSHERYLEEVNILKDFGSGRVDGVLMSIASETCESQHIRSLLEKDVPVVLFDRVCDDVKTARVSTDDKEAGYTATEHLISRGCRRILYLSISESLSISTERLQGYRQALTGHGLPVEDKNIILCTGNAEQMKRTIEEALSQGRGGPNGHGHRGPNGPERGDERPDGIVASVEKLVTPVYLACKALHLSIPGDVKVICFSNMPQASLLSPALTTITQPAFEIGKAAACLLFKAMEKADFDLGKASSILPSVLTIREST